MNNDFYTLTTYIHNNNYITYAMEDYLEMIYRKNTVTITSLSKLLNIKKPSCSKMIHKLNNLNLVNINNNYITLSESGLKIGEYLYNRHLIIENFLKKLNQENFKLEQVEKIEHFIDNITLNNLKDFLNNNY